MIYYPGEGRYLISTAPFEGAVEGRVAPGQIKFTLDGQDYLLLTAMPTTRSEHVWVTHDPQYQTVRAYARCARRPVNVHGEKPPQAPATTNTPHHVTRIADKRSKTSQHSSRVQIS